MTATATYVQEYGKPFGQAAAMTVRPGGHLATFGLGAVPADRLENWKQWFYMRGWKDAAMHPLQGMRTIGDPPASAWAIGEAQDEGYRQAALVASEDPFFMSGEVGDDVRAVLKRDYDDGYNARLQADQQAERDRKVKNVAWLAAAFLVGALAGGATTYVLTD